MPRVSVQLTLAIITPHPLHLHLVTDICKCTQHSKAIDNALYLLRCPRSCHLRFKPYHKARCTLPATNPTQEPSHRLTLPRPALLCAGFLPMQFPSSGGPFLPKPPNILSSAISEAISSIKASLMHPYMDVMSPP